MLDDSFLEGSWRLLLSDHALALYLPRRSSWTISPWRFPCAILVVSVAIQRLYWEILFSHPTWRRPGLPHGKLSDYSQALGFSRHGLLEDPTLEASWPHLTVSWVINYPLALGFSRHGSWTIPPWRFPGAISVVGRRSYAPVIPTWRILASPHSKLLFTRVGFLRPGCWMIPLWRLPGAISVVSGGDRSGRFYCYVIPSMKLSWPHLTVNWATTH